MLSTLSLTIALLSQKSEIHVVGSQIPIVFAVGEPLSNERYQSLLEAAQLVNPNEVLSKSGAKFIRKDEIVYIIDRESLGIEFLANVAKAFENQSKDVNSPMCTSELQKGLLPLLSVPYKNYPVVSMNNVELTTGLFVKLEDANKQTKVITTRNKPVKKSDPTFLDLRKSWKEGYKKPSNFYLYSATLSISGIFNESQQMREAQFEALNIAWSEYENVKKEYNEALQKLNDAILPGTLPFYPDNSMVGKEVSQLTKEESKYLAGTAFDIDNPSRDWSKSKIVSATTEIYLNATFLLEDGSTVGFSYAIPSRLP